MHRSSLPFPGVSPAAPLGRRASSSRPGWMLQRKCACGGETGPDGECEQCREKRLQRKAITRDAGAHQAAIPPVVHDVLRSSGQPLDQTTRTFAESRFGQDFSHVRVHADARASESAKSVGALAYTVGPNVVFSAGQYAPQTPGGRWLLSHELAHVVQQGSSSASTTGADLSIGDPADASEQAADRAADAAVAGNTVHPSAHSVGPVLARRVVGSARDCPGGRHGAPADPATALSAIEAHAQSLSAAGAVLAQLASSTIAMGIDFRSTGVGQAYLSRFGLPPATRGGFFNRLTGQVKRQQNDVVADELEGLGNRLQRISDHFDRPIHYPCIGGDVTIMGCGATCRGRSATSCAGIPVILLCPSFWELGPNSQATLLIHESAHMLWANVVHVRNFRHASCYANFVADLMNAPTTTPACPTP